MSAPAYFSFPRYLPAIFRVPLCGKREWSTRERDADDPDWQAWQADYIKFYTAISRNGVGKTVNEFGYSVLSSFDLTSKCCLEIGPGTFPHMVHWQGRPEQYDIADTNVDFLQESSNVLRNASIPCTPFLLDSSPRLPMQDETYDVIVSFYSLEHLFDLEKYLQEFNRVLRKGGVLIGAIPTEGGLAWGLGRMLTSRRWTRKHCTWDFDKIIAWEHCNTAEYILTSLDRHFSSVKKSWWPLRIPLIDTNLVIKFQYKKTATREIA